MKRNKKSVIPDFRMGESKEALPHAREASKIYRVRDDYFDQLEENVLEGRFKSQVPVRKYIKISAAVAAILAVGLLISRYTFNATDSSVIATPSEIALEKVPSDLDIKLAVVGDEILEQALQNDSVHVDYGSREWLVDELSQIPDSSLADYLLLQNTSLTEMAAYMTN
jgi:hypothetical protein